jgi:hypothetical protein
MIPISIIGFILLTLISIFMVLMVLFFDKLSWIVKVQKEKINEVIRSIKTLQIMAISIMTLSFCYLSAALITSKNFDTSEVILLLNLFSISALLFVVSVLLKHRVFLIEKNDRK